MRKTLRILVLTVISIVILLLNINITSYATTTTAVDWIKTNWLNYPSDIGKWTTTTINGNPAIGSTQNVDWSGYVNKFAMDSKDSVFEFKMYQNETSDDDNMGWTFRHNYINSPTSYANHSFYVFVTNGGNKNGGNIPSGLYKKSYGTNIAWNPNHGMKLLKGFTFSRLQKTLYNVKLEVKDEAGGTRIKGYIDGVEVLNYLDTDPIPSGGYGPFSFSQAQAYFYDINVNGSSVYNIPPTIAITNPGNNTSVNPNSNLVITGVANDEDNRGTLSTYYQIDDNSPQLIWTKTQTGIPLEISKTIPIASNIEYGNHTITIWSKDSENAESQKITLDFFVNDITNPTALHSIINNSNGTKTIVVESQDSESGVKNIKLPNGTYVSSNIASYNIPNENKDYNFEIEDNAGNKLIYSVEISDVLTNVILSSILNDYISLNWTVDDTWQTYKYNIYSKTQSDSTYIKRYSSLTALTQKDTTSIDITKPSMPNLTNVIVDGLNSNITVSFNNSTDYGTTYNHYIEAIGVKNGAKANSNIVTNTITSGLKGYSIVIDNNPTTIPDKVIETTNTQYSISKEINGAQFYVHIIAVDNANNISNVTHYLYSDNFSPSMTLTPNTINPTNQDVQIIVNATDNETGVRRIRLPNGQYVNGAIVNYSISVNGTYTFLAEDFAGNTYSKDIVVQNIDKIAPIATHTILSTANNGFYNETLELRISATDSGAGVKRIRLPNGQYVNGTTATYTINTNNSYNFTIEDNVGNTSVYTVPIKNISYKPTLNLENQNGEIKLTWSIADKSQLFDFEIYKSVNDSDFNLLTTLSSNANNTYIDTQTKDIANPLAPTIKSYSMENGVVTVSFNQSEDVGTTYKYYIVAKGLSNKAITSSEVKQLSIISNIKGYSYIVDCHNDTIPDNEIDITSTENINFDIDKKTMYVHIKAIDNAGNSSQAYHYEITDNITPTLSLSLEPSTWTNGSVTINATAIDSGSGIKQIILPNGAVIKATKSSYVVSKNGLYYFSTIDYSGNSKITSIIVSNIDKNNPTVIIQNNQAWTNQNVEVNIISNDN